MKLVKLLVVSVVILALQGCIKTSVLMPSLTIPNSDFEGWTADDQLQQWKTNSCPECEPAFNTYIVQKTTEAYHGQFAAKLVYNGVYPATASTKFVVAGHPNGLTGYVKCLLYDLDTVCIKVRVFNKNAVVDSGKWISTQSITDYKQFVIPITQSSAHADSVSISIKGGHVFNPDGSNSTLWVDYFCIR